MSTWLPWKVNLVPPDAAVALVKRIMPPLHSTLLAALTLKDQFVP